MRSSRFRGIPVQRQRVREPLRPYLRREIDAPNGMNAPQDGVTPRSEPIPSRGRGGTNVSRRGRF